MKYYLLPFVAYLLVSPVINFLFQDLFLAYALSTVIVGILILLFWQKFELKFKFDIWAIIAGVLIFLCWILLEGKYPLFFIAAKIFPANTIQLIIRFVGFVIVTPLIEELFTRGFLIRFLVSEKWQKVQAGKFTWLSFVVTVLFFGFSHAEWLQGIVAGIILNLLYYRSKNVSSCILAHSIANLLLFLI